MRGIHTKNVCVFECVCVCLRCTEQLSYGLGVKSGAIKSKVLLMCC